MINVTSTHQIPPLHCFCIGELQSKIQTLLTDEKYDVNQTDSLGNTALSFTCNYLGTSILNTLLKSDRLRVNNSLNQTSPLKTAFFIAPEQNLKTILSDRRFAPFSLELPENTEFHTLQPLAVNIFWLCKKIKQLDNIHSPALTRVARMVFEIMGKQAYQAIFYEIFSEDYTSHLEFLSNYLKSKEVTKLHQLSAQELMEHFLDATSSGDAVTVKKIVEIYKKKLRKQRTPSRRTLYSSPSKESSSTDSSFNI